MKLCSSKSQEIGRVLILIRLNFHAAAGNQKRTAPGEPQSRGAYGRRRQANVLKNVASDHGPVRRRKRDTSSNNVTGAMQEDLVER